MRTLVLTRGTPGSGKSTWIKSNNLFMYTLEPDFIRLMVQSPQLIKTGQQVISPTNDKYVWNLLFQMLETRMERGELVVVDATHSRTSQLNKYRQLAQAHRYRVVLVDFSDVPLQTALTQNRQRDSYKHVPDEAIERTFYRLQTEHIPNWVTTIKPNEWPEYSNIQHDLSDYEQIVVFGDVHSCTDPINEYFVTQPFNKDYFYIFVGDYFDRGLQHVETFKLLHPLSKEKNTLFLTGNHEVHLRNYIRNKFSYQNIKMPLASRATFDAFEAAGIANSDLKDFYNRLGQLAYFKYHNKVYTVTHGGLPCLPGITTPTFDFIKGVGTYSESEEVDQAFVNNTLDFHYQIHGHRNIHKAPIQNTDRTFNLNGNQEFGGTFRMMTINRLGVACTEIQNNTFDTSLDSEDSFLPAVKLEQANNLLSYFQHKKDVIVKDLQTGVYAVNFSRKVFHKRTWDEINTKARGLFLDASGAIVARSYDKFFNWDERPETESRTMSKTIQGPIAAYNKENGFLGIMSVHKDEWFIASKSTDKGDFADMFRELVTPHLTDILKNIVTSKNISLVFEVIHHKDPHICKYTEDQVILLDVIYNEPVFKKYNYRQLTSFGNLTGFKVKQLTTLHPDFVSLQQWRRTADQASIELETSEGFVFEDTNGFQWKYKTPFYKFWKRMRGFKDRLVKTGSDHANIRKHLHSSDDFKVYNFMLTYSIEDLKTMSIIDVQQAYLRI